MKYDQCPVCGGTNIQVVNGYKILENGDKYEQLKTECFDCKFSVVSGENFHATDEDLEKYTNSNQTKFEWNNAIRYITI